MAHSNGTLANILRDLELGSSVAESDSLLEVARVETSAFYDLLQDRVDLVPGTKGSGKSALFRIFVDFLPERLLRSRKVVVAHGVQSPGDPVFHAFSEEFSTLDEQQFVSFWCIYLVSLAHEQFIKGKRYLPYLEETEREMELFRRACQSARIPEIKARKKLRDIIQWALSVLKQWHPKLTYKSPDDSGDIEFDLFGQVSPLPAEAESISQQEVLPRYVNDIKEALEMILRKAELTLWLMIDRLDEIFPRRSDVERTALRGLLRAMRIFSSEIIRVKVFLRDDMLEQVVRTDNGFTALTHITARQADTLRWTEDQILTMVVKRLFANHGIASYLDIDSERLEASAEYRTEFFYKVFPKTVHRGRKQSTTLRWIYNRCADGRGVVTPRDVIDLLSRAKQHQQDEFRANTAGRSDWIIGPSSLQYGLQELSKRKRQTYLEAEFPHLWRYIEKFINGKTQYDELTLNKYLGKEWNMIIDDLISIGLFTKTISKGKTIYSVPFLYRYGLELTQGQA